ncbi:MAG: hypothetical protein AVDCRST_MAG86-4429, partial [uncultured Truepera sp.]
VKPVRRASKVSKYSGTSAAGFAGAKPCPTSTPATHRSQTHRFL